MVRSVHYEQVTKSSPHSWGGHYTECEDQEGRPLAVMSDAPYQISPGPADLRDAKYEVLILPKTTLPPLNSSDHFPYLTGFYILGAVAPWGEVYEY